MSQPIRPIFVASAAVSAAVVGYAFFGLPGAVTPLAGYGLHKIIQDCITPQKESKEEAPAPLAPPRVSSFSSSSSSSSTPVASGLSFSETKARNIAIFRENTGLMANGGYTSEFGGYISVEAPKERDTLLIDPNVQKGNGNDYARIGGKSLTPKDTKIEVINEDCLDVTLDLKAKGFNPILLNMANQTHRGGGYEDGARAQEEDICRRTTLYAALGTVTQPNRAFQGRSVMQFRYKTEYNIPEFGCIASRNVEVLRDNKYNLLGKREKDFIDVLSSAAYDLNPRHERTRGGSLNPRGSDWADHNKSQYENNVKQKIKNILKTAILSGHDAIVLSAFGCGAFNNDPKVVARLFNEVLNETTDISGLDRKTYKDAIKAVFAIIGDHNDTKGNFKNFQNQFK